jgi:hypothetical protein
MKNHDEAAARRTTLEFAAMGRVAAGAAYELDPPLARILIHLRMLIEESVTANDGKHAVLLQRTLEAADRIAETVRGLRAFTSVDDSAQGVDVHEAVEIAVHLAMHAIAPRAALVRRYRHVPRVRGNLGRLTQVLTSVLGNAAQSIPRSIPQANTIAIETGLDAAGQVTVDVVDTGAGIEPSELPFVFDPFFTTKPGAASQGLGLAAARFAMLEMGGGITLESTAGRGSHVRITLSAIETDEVLFLPAYESKTAPSRRVLCVAETSAGARRLGDLARDGEVEVLFARWSDALERLALGESFDLVLCEAEGARRVGFREQLGHVAPDVLPRTFAVVLRSSASGTFARVQDPSDEIELGASETAWSKAAW